MFTVYLYVLMLRCLICFFLALTAVLKLSAQQSAFHGVIFQQGTPYRVAQAEIRNIQTGTSSRSDNLGEFLINAASTDTLLITKAGYADYKLTAVSKKPVLIQLIKMHQLSEVVITARTKKQEMDEVISGFRKKGVYFNGKPPLLSYIFKPLTAMYELIGKDPGNARRFNNYYHRQLEESEIDRRFNEALVKRLTKMEMADLQNFMSIYRPAYEKIINWNEYDLMSYISRSFKAFNAAGRPAPASLPPLSGLK